MNQRYQQGQSMGRQGGRPEYDDGRRAYQPEDMGEGEYLGSYPSDDGPQYYQPRGQGPFAPQDRYGQPQYAQRGPFAPQGRYAQPQPQGRRAMGSAYGPEDFRQGAHEGEYGGYGNQDYRQGSTGRQGQRSFAGQGGRASSSAQQGYGYGNYRQSRYQGGMDYDEGDYDQAFGGYSPSQHGYGQGWSGYGRGGYGATGAQEYNDDYMAQTGGGYSQGLAGRGGYGLGSSYAGQGQRESQFGKGPRGYVRSDERLKEDISERLMRDHDVDASDIDIEVRNGKVTLNGSIDDRRLKHYIEDTVEACVGVKDIDNRLTVRPRATSRLQGGSGSLGGSTGDGGAAFAGQSSATGTTGSRASTTGTAGTTNPTATGNEDGSPRSRN